MHERRLAAEIIGGVVKQHVNRNVNPCMSEVAEGAKGECVDGQIIAIIYNQVHVSRSVSVPGSAFLLPL